MTTEQIDAAAGAKRIGQFFDWSINLLVFASLLTFFASFGRSVPAAIVALLALNALALSWLASNGLSRLLVTFRRQFPEFTRRKSISVLRRKGVLMVPVLIIGTVFICIVAVRLIVDFMADSLAGTLTPPSEMTGGGEDNLDLQAARGTAGGMAMLYTASVIMHFLAIAGVFYLLWARKSIMQALKEIEVMDDVGHAFREPVAARGAGNSWQS